MLQALACRFAQLAVHELPGIKIQELVTEPKWDTKKCNLWESEESHEECIVVIDSETDKAFHAL